MKAGDFMEFTEILNNYITIFSEKDSENVIISLTSVDLKDFDTGLGKFIANNLRFTTNLKKARIELEKEIDLPEDDKLPLDMEEVKKIQIKTSLYHYLKAKETVLINNTKFLNFRSNTKKKYAELDYFNDSNYILMRDEYLFGTIANIAEMVSLKYGLINLSSKYNITLDEYNFEDFGIYLSGNSRNTKEDTTEGVKYFRSLKNALSNYLGRGELDSLSTYQKEAIVMEILSPNFLRDRLNKTNSRDF